MTGHDVIDPLSPQRSVRQFVMPTARLPTCGLSARTGQPYGRGHRHRGQNQADDQRHDQRHLQVDQAQRIQVGFRQMERHDFPPDDRRAGARSGLCEDPAKAVETMCTNSPNMRSLDPA